MEPIIFGSLEEQQCVSNFTNSRKLNKKSPKSTCVIKISANWKGNLNYWTGGIQGCKGLWGWCAGSKFLPLSASLKWAAQQPEYKKGNENCLHMRIYSNQTGAVLSDRQCKDRYVFACEVFNF